MAYVVGENCIKCKTTECIEVCPVECFFEGENMVVINPDDCIDCGVCEPECPVEAIRPDTITGWEYWIELNKKYSSLWPNITKRRLPPGDWEVWKEKYQKLEFFSPKPGEGD